MARTSCDIVAKNVDSGWRRLEWSQLTGWNVDVSGLFSTVPAAKAKRRSAPYLGLDEWHHEGFDRAILLMLVAYGPPELMHEAKDGILLLSQPSGVHLTDTSYADLTRGVGQTPKCVNFPCYSIEV
jgi:hypothetical protein